MPRGIVVKGPAVQMLNGSRIEMYAGCDLADLNELGVTMGDVVSFSLARAAPVAENIRKVKPTAKELAFKAAGCRVVPTKASARKLIADALTRADLIGHVPSTVMRAALSDIDPTDRCAAAKLLAALPEQRKRVAFFELSSKPSAATVEAFSRGVRAEFTHLHVGEIRDDAIAVTAKLFGKPIGEHSYRDLRGFTAWVNDMLRVGRRPAQLAYLPSERGGCAIVASSSTSSALRKAKIRVTDEPPR